MWGAGAGAGQHRGGADWQGRGSSNAEYTALEAAFTTLLSFYSLCFMDIRYYLEAILQFINYAALSASQFSFLLLVTFAVVRFPL